MIKAKKPTKKKVTKYKKVGFFKKFNFRLLIIVLLAAAIPFTVMAVQHTQDIRQEAAVPQACDGSKLLNANPRPVTRGEEIIFSHTDGPITENMFENEDFTGNGVDQNSCKFDSSNGWIRCSAKGNDSSKLKDSEGNTISNHTWTFRGIQCNYVVKIPKSQNTNKPKNTPKPSPTRPAGGFCTGSFAPAECTVDNKPRMRVSYDMRGGVNGKCQAVIEQGTSKWIVSSKCDNAEGLTLSSLTDANGSKINFKPNTKYKFTVSNGSDTCRKAVEATTKNCGQTTTTESKTQNTIQCNAYFSNPKAVTAGQLCVDSHGNVISCPNCTN